MCYCCCCCVFISRSASNYESLYEPIQPRNHHHSPAGSMSSLTRPSHYTTSPYPPYGGSSSSTSYGGSVGGGSAAAAALKPQTGHANKGATSPVQEEEVDALTNLLVQSMDNAADPEFFGMCADCGLKVVGEGSGCTAMDRVFHIACFTCRICNCRLQGKPFYAVDGEPHCQECYLNSLEKCCVCSEPILDRILRATGKPYHPQCFTCIVCHLCLDGIPFTVDAANRIHCIDDFHKKFAPRCSVCHDPIMPEPGQEETVRVVALDRSFHVQCYKCEDCELVLSSEAEGRGCYPLDGRVLCKSCNAIRVNALTSNTSTEL